MSQKAALIAVSALLSLAPAAAQAQPTIAPIDLRLTYDGRLYFIKVLDLQFQQRVSEGGFGAGAQLRSYGLLAAFKKFDIKAQSSGRVDARGPQPGAFNYINHDGKRTRHVTTNWTHDAVEMTSTPTFSDLGDPPASLEQKLAAADPLTQLLRITVGAPLRPCEGSPRFFDGKQLYELAFNGAHPETPDDQQKALGMTSLVRCTLHYAEIAGYKKKSPAKKPSGLTSPITITFGQIGAGGPWLMAEMQADSSIGPATIILREAHISHGEG